MLASEENYSGRDQRLELDIAVYAQIISVAKKVWIRLPSSKAPIEELSAVRQGPQDFVSRITQASIKLIVDTEAGLLIIKQLAFENTNTVCKATF